MLEPEIPIVSARPDSAKRDPQATTAVPLIPARPRKQAKTDENPSTDNGIPQRSPTDGDSNDSMFLSPHYVSDSVIHLDVTSGEDKDSDGVSSAEVLLGIVSELYDESSGTEFRAETPSITCLIHETDSKSASNEEPSMSPIELDKEDTTLKQPADLSPEVGFKGESEQNISIPVEVQSEQLKVTEPIESSKNDGPVIPSRPRKSNTKSPDATEQPSGDVSANIEVPKNIPEPSKLIEPELVEPSDSDDSEDDKYTTSLTNLQETYDSEAQILDQHDNEFDSKSSTLEEEPALPDLSHLQSKTEEQHTDIPQEIRREVTFTNEAGSRADTSALVEADITSSDRDVASERDVTHGLKLDTDLINDTQPIVPKRPAKSTTPKIPSRPVREKPVESKHEPEKVSANESGDDSVEKEFTVSKPEDASVTKKAPPQKPKKLSLKIAAFQQMFSQTSLEQTRPKSPSFERGKLSSNRAEFASNLRNMMDRGIPLLGMASPEIVKKLSAPEPSNNESQSEESSDHTASTGTPRRARGPRGKRLPKLIQDTTIEVEPRFQVSAANVWEVKLSKKRAQESGSIERVDKKNPEQEVPEQETDGSGLIGDETPQQDLDEDDTVSKPQKEGLFALLSNEIEEQKPRYVLESDENRSTLSSLIGVASDDTAGFNSARDTDGSIYEDAFAHDQIETEMSPSEPSQSEENSRAENDHVDSEITLNVASKLEDSPQESCDSTYVDVKEELGGDSGVPDAPTIVESSEALSSSLSTGEVGTESRPGPV